MAPDSELLAMQQERLGARRIVESSPKRAVGFKNESCLPLVII